MNFPFITNPRNNRKDPTLTLVVLATLVCVVKFLFEGVSFDIAGHAVSLGHADALTYGALLTPVLGAHGYLSRNSSKKEDKDNACGN